ncbi:MAG: ParA family protein [Clostridia bacterium]|nr:ParA family protein [Clostridia bacterium]
MKIIAVANQKGGVGKTTSVVNLASCLAEAGKKVLLVDLDPQGNATSGCGINKRQIKASLYQVMVGDLSLENAVTQTKFKNLWILPSTMDLAGAEVELVDVEKREQSLKNALFQPCSVEFDYVFIDCPPSLGLLTLNALVCAHTVLIPIQCEFYALEGLSQLTNTIRQVRRLYNPTLDIEGILITMYDGRLNLTTQVLAEVKKYFAGKIFKTVIPRNVRISEAPSHGEPINYYDKHAKGALAYRDLAKELMDNDRRRGT